MRALLAIESYDRVDELVRRLRFLGVCPIVAPGVDQATRLLATSRPDVAILADGAQPASLLYDLELKGVPVVLVADSEQLTQVPELRVPVAVVLSPAEVDEIADAALIAGADMPNVLEVGSLRLDLDAHLVFLDAEAVELPPKEFAVLAHLALRPGEPVSTAELARTLWPGVFHATAEDVHRHVYRLRKLIGDHSRLAPLIASRRGYGYVLNVPRESEAHPARSISAGSRSS